MQFFKTSRDPQVLDPKLQQQTGLQRYRPLDTTTSESFPTGEVVKLRRCQPRYSPTIARTAALPHDGAGASAKWGQPQML
jgi:hypothetical protein